MEGLEHLQENEEPVFTVISEPVKSPEQVGKQIAELLVKDGHITNEQLKYALRIFAKIPSKKTLVNILQELHLVTPEKLRTTLHANALSVPLGALLLELGYIREPDLRSALTLQSANPGRKLGEILTESNFITEDELVEVLSYQLGFERLYPSKSNYDPEFFHTAPVIWFQSKDCIPVARRDGKVAVAFADPLDNRQVEAVSKVFGDISVGIARRDEIRQALNRAANAEIRTAGSYANETNVLKMVDDLIVEAAETSISDIHVETTKNLLRVRFRKDGVLIKHKDLPLEWAKPVTSRIKIMANLDLAEKRGHQDGRILFDFHGNPLDIRVSIYGTIYGETIVMRLLKNLDQLLDIREIGMAPGVADRYIEDALEVPSGVIIISGPTGSGKTTTLYSSVHHLNKTDTSIITAEDPVEYIIDGISQCSINPKINVTYEDTLKHIMQQDPDVIVIGEIRDLFSTKTAIRAALTGHKVLTTFHTEDSIGGLLRLVNMNIEPFLISSTVTCILAQRLVRRLCPHCSEDYPLNTQEIRRLGYEPRDALGMVFKTGRGCVKCQFRGYSGRVGIFELFVLNEMVRDAIIARKTSYEIRRLSLESAELVTLLEDAIYKASQGLTSYEEILRKVPRLSRPRPLQEIHQHLGGD
jgi:type IV pilus assembly protein PilB